MRSWWIVLVSAAAAAAVVIDMVALAVGWVLGGCVGWVGGEPTQSLVGESEKRGGQEVVGCSDASDVIDGE